MEGVLVYDTNLTPAHWMCSINSFFQILTGVHVSVSCHVSVSVIYSSHIKIYTHIKNKTKQNPGSNQNNSNNPKQQHQQKHHHNHKFPQKQNRAVWESNLNSTMKNATKTNTILKDLIDLKNGIISFFGSTIRYIIYMKYHIRHLSNKKKFQTFFKPTSLFSL